MPYLNVFIYAVIVLVITNESEEAFFVMFINLNNDSNIKYKKSPNYEYDS
ncbi:hypothetical protein PIROE2DRAFT_6020 [Piromyces sp. E2]|nr:hypothetical protein PIROE2DRAFT_6020 [Piromyces sp. E2]|eukprot:OUM66705.1 hypothetical protein PIROE2DRAFT_6020 [Piromyces sp. E2]